MRLLLFSYLLFLSVQTLYAQWQYETTSKGNEKIFVEDHKNTSVFIIEKATDGVIRFVLENISSDGCPINSVLFGFDNYTKKISFNVKEVGESSLEILYDELLGLTGLKNFTALVKAKNTLYTKLIDACNLNSSITFSLKGSSKSIDKIELIPYLERTIQILEAKQKKIDFIVNSIPRLRNKTFEEKRLGDINLLEVIGVSWKNSGQDKYAIKIRVKTRNQGYHELYGDFRLFKPTETIKFRY
ncbi:MAG: hypothetical protein ABGW63_03945 [Flavobacteriaceae bacterium]